MSREKPPLSSILDRVAIYYVRVQTHHVYPPCMRAMSPVVCSGCTRRSEGCCCCSIPFRPLQPRVRQKTTCVLCATLPLRCTRIAPGIASGSAGAALSLDRARCAAVRGTRCEPGTI
jgi:hypothetical protein